MRLQRVRLDLATEQQQQLVMMIFSCAHWPSVCLLWEIVYSDPLFLYFLFLLLLFLLKSLFLHMALKYFIL